MAASHHGPEDQARQEELMRRFTEQVEGTAKRQYSAGRIGPDDEGDLAVAVAADKEHGRVVLHFGKPVEWAGLTPPEAVALAEMLIEKARQVSKEPLTLRVAEPVPK